MFLQHHIIIDDFYPDPEYVRTWALSAPLHASKGNYAGRMTESSFYTDEHTKIFQSITGEEVYPAKNLNGHFRFTLQDEIPRQYIHFDPGPGQIWAGVVYLSHQSDIDSVPQHELTGTVFWRHNRTGLTTLPLQQQILDQYGWHDTDDLKNFLEQEGTQEQLWTKILHVPARFNRLVLFRPWMFHSPGHGFGDNIYNCRLIQVIFLRMAEP